MYEDIVICEMDHIDPTGNEYCNPTKYQLVIQPIGILLSLVFRRSNSKKTVCRFVNIVPLQISVETLNNDKIEIKDKYDVQEAVKISITDR